MTHKHPTFNLARLTLALVGTAVVSSLAIAKPDADGDGKVSRDEMLRHRTEQVDKKFAKKDTNQDGQISMDEMAGKKGGIGKKADINKDGVVTKDEAHERAKESVDKAFAKKDTNQDGALDESERKKGKKDKKGIKADKGAKDKANKGKSNKDKSTKGKKKSKDKPADELNTESP